MQLFWPPQTNAKICKWFLVKFSSSNIFSKLFQLRIVTLLNSHRAMNRLFFFFVLSKWLGACEILGVFCGLFLILYTKRKWLYTGIFNMIGGLIVYAAWWIPTDRKWFEYNSIYLKSLICRVFCVWNSWNKSSCNFTHADINGVKSCDIINIGHSNDMYYRIGVRRKEKNLRLFDDCLRSHLVADRTVHWCHNRFRRFNTANGFINTIHHRWST